MNVNAVLWKCTEDALMTLGKSAMYMLVWQISRSGVETTPDKFDIRKFAAALRVLLGEGSESVLNIVYKNLLKRMQVEADPDPDLLPLEKIMKLLEAKKMNY